MTTFAPKTYQQQVLDSVEAYLPRYGAHGTPYGRWDGIDAHLA